MIHAENENGQPLCGEPLGVFSQTSTELGAVTCADCQRERERERLQSSEQPQ